MRRQLLELCAAAAAVPPTHQIPGPDRTGQGTMGHAVETALNAFVFAITFADRFPAAEIY